MKVLISYVLLLVGLVCAGRAISMAVEAASHQEELSRTWGTSETLTPKPGFQPPHGVVARMRFERLNREVFILGDEDPKNLSKGPVWLRMTRSFSSGGNTVIAGHRDTHFRFLKDVRVGDTFDVDGESHHHTYKVSLIRIVQPVDRALLAPTANKVVTLVTCYPFYVVGKANRRIIIRAEVVDPLPAPAKLN